MKRMKTWEGWLVVDRRYAYTLPPATVYMHKPDAVLRLITVPRVESYRLARVRVTEVVKPKRRKPR